MGNDRIKHSIKILECAVKLLDNKSNEGLQNLSLIRKPDNVVHLKHLNNDDDFGVNTLMACQRIPSLILLSLTVEQTLKLIIKQETNKEYRIHELKKLFENLPSVFQNEITNQVMIDLNIDLQSFNEKLLENSTVFINWRYFYESQNPNTAGVGFLQTFYKRLKDKII
jgi:hypothetical protein